MAQALAVQQGDARSDGKPSCSPDGSAPDFERTGSRPSTWDWLKFVDNWGFLRAWVSDRPLVSSARFACSLQMLPSLGTMMAMVLLSPVGKSEVLDLLERVVRLGGACAVTRSALDEYTRKSVELVLHVADDCDLQEFDRRQNCPS